MDRIDEVFAKLFSLGDAFDFPRIAPLLSRDEMKGYEAHVIGGAISGGNVYLSSKSINEMNRRYEDGLKQWMSGISVERKIAVLMKVSSASDIRYISDEVGEFNSRDV